MTLGYELKLERAIRHFKETRDLLTAYKNPRPYTIRRDENPNTGLSFWIILNRKPPDGIALAAGDCVHNLRSALDHIVYELSCHNRQVSHVGSTAFPIYVDAKDWDEKDSTGKLRVTSGLQGLEARYWTRERLLHVHQLDIADKHRSLNLAVANVPENSVLYGHNGPPLKVTDVFKGRLVEGVETLLLRFDPAVDVQAKVEPYTFVEVVFADPPVEDWEVKSAIEGLVVGVDAVLREMRAFF
jgi:hypothetical protein